MEQMKDLKALLMHDVLLLQSVEEQITEALPAMIEQAQSPDLKNALREHLQVTQLQLGRISQLRDSMNVTEDDVTRYTGVLATMFGSPTKCRGMEGLIEEGQKLMAENLSPEVMDAAIIGSCQKIEHFEIASYGTARSFAEQLGMTDAAQILQQILDEEYEADRILTGLAITMVNQTAAAGA